MALELKKRPSKKDDATAEPTKASKKAQAALDKPFVAELPIVNLLPADVLEVVEQQRLKRLFIVLTIALIAAVAAVYLAQTGVIAVAKGKLQDEQDRTATLTAKQSELIPVKTYYQQIEANRKTIQDTMAKEVLTSQVLSDLDKVTPGGVTISNTAVTLDSGGVAPAAGAAPAPAQATGACPSQDPYNASGLSAGCVTVDGSATSRQALGDWLDRIQASDTFTVAFIPSTSAGEDNAVTFSATIGLSDIVYLNRYAEITAEAGTN